ncbi:MAG: hypothetical protein H0X03_03555 [Nitrosopumilus sp.]|nr:hypothetical protein [Nitrosopumilus sp.]
MHIGVVRNLQRMADEAKRNGNPPLFLTRFSPVHVRWHGSSRIPGFLLFHWHAVEHVKDLGIDSMLGVNPYVVNDFRPGGDFADADWDDYMGSFGPSSTLDELAEYSFQLENWHNNSHMVIGNATGTDLMNPATNIFLREFWNLHFFINQRFENEMKSYAEANHPTINTAAAIVRHIENSHHRYVRSI